MGKILSTPDVTVYWYGAGVKSEFVSEVKKRLLKAALMVERKAKELMAEAKHGRWYLKPNTSAMYQASAPGEAPAVRTGVLQSSVSHTQPKMGIDGIIHCYVGSDIDYALYLELGVKRQDIGIEAEGGDWRVAPRPWLRPALDMNRAAIVAIMRAPLTPSFVLSGMIGDRFRNIVSYTPRP